MWSAMDETQAPTSGSQAGYLGSCQELSQGPWVRGILFRSWWPRNETLTTAEVVWPDKRLRSYTTVAE